MHAHPLTHTHTHSHVHRNLQELFRAFDATQPAQRNKLHLNMQYHFKINYSFLSSTPPARRHTHTHTRTHVLIHTRNPCNIYFMCVCVSIICVNIKTKNKKKTNSKLTKNCKKPKTFHTLLQHSVSENWYRSLINLLSFCLVQCVCVCVRRPKPNNNENTKCKYWKKKANAAYA